MCLAAGPWRVRVPCAEPMTIAVSGTSVGGNHRRTRSATVLDCTVCSSTVWRHAQVCIARCCDDGVAAVVAVARHAPRIACAATVPRHRVGPAGSRNYGRPLAAAGHHRITTAMQFQTMCVGWCAHRCAHALVCVCARSWRACVRVCAITPTVCVRSCACVRPHARVCARMCAHTHASVCDRPHTCLCVCGGAPACVGACAGVRAGVSVCVCVCVCVRVCLREIVRERVRAPVCERAHAVRPVVTVCAGVCVRERER